MCFSQSKLGSIFGIDTVASFSLPRLTNPDLIIVKSTNHFQIEDITNFSLLVSNTELQTTLMFHTFSSSVFRSLHAEVMPSFVIDESLKLDIGFSYFYEWYKSFGSETKVGHSVAINYRTFINIYFKTNSSIGEGYDIRISKRYKGFGLQFQTFLSPLNIYRRVTIYNQIDELNLFLGLQNGNNFLLTGISLQINKILFRFGYEEYHELGSRYQFSIRLFLLNCCSWS